jgi:YjbE family integral membrane protein
MHAGVGTAVVQILEIIWINLLLSGDNAVVIALACRSLPPEKRRTGVIFGTCAAVALRILFTLIVVTLLGVPFLRLIGGATVVWIAIGLLDEDAHDGRVSEASTIWRAVRIIAIADAVMSLDNVIAIAAAAKGSLWLIVFGLVLSIPLIVSGASLVMAALDRLPILLWAGVALLGWIAGGLAITDPALAQFSPAVENVAAFASLAGAILVVLIGLVLRRMRGRGAT